MRQEAHARHEELRADNLVLAEEMVAERERQEQDRQANVLLHQWCSHMEVLHRDRTGQDAGNQQQ